MTDEIVMLQSRIDALQIHCAAVEADNARLRAVVEAGRGADSGWCVWCDQMGKSGSRDPDVHMPDCLAFTTSGEVR